MFTRRACVISILAVVSVGLSFAAKNDERSFEGKWKLDKKRLDQSAKAPAELEQRLRMKGSKLIIESKYEEPESGLYPLHWLGVMTYRFELNTDGSETVNFIGPFRHESKTTIEGNRMTTDWNAGIENGTANGQWVRTLSPDGKEMNLQVKGKASDGRIIDSTLVFFRR